MAPSFDSALHKFCLEKSGNQRSHRMEKQLVSLDNRAAKGIGPVDRTCHILEASVDKGIESSAAKEPVIGGNSTDVENMASPALHITRFCTDFEKIRSLGHGGFGQVVLVKNKLDGQKYAIKRIHLLESSVEVRESVLREAKMLSLLDHKHVIRYFQSWIEDEFGNIPGAAPFYSNETETDSMSSSMKPAELLKAAENEKCTYLYIQMEYCPRTLREELDLGLIDKDLKWLQFHQIVTGLQHVHHHGIVHCDLKPDNVFIDAHKNVKIGDFGLAKFMESEHGLQDQYLSAEKAEAFRSGSLQVGTHFYKAPEFNPKFPIINEKIDMYSLGVMLFEMGQSFKTKMERYIVLSKLKEQGLPHEFSLNYPRESTVLELLLSLDPSDRPTATELIHDILPPRVERECLQAVLRSLRSSEDKNIYDQVVSTIFDEERLMNVDTQDGWHWNVTRNMAVETERRDKFIEFVREIFVQYNARRLEVLPIRASDPNLHMFSKNKVNLLSGGGSTLELCDELRSSFISWITALEITHFRRYEISWVYRSASEHSTPDRLLQGAFDIVGGSSLFSDAETIKVVMDIATKIFCPENIHIHVNHGRILKAIWSWIGIPEELRLNVVKHLSLLGSACPHSTNRKRNWSESRQLLQELDISEDAIYRIGTVESRFCGSVDISLAKLMGVLSHDTIACKALENLSAIYGFLKALKISDQVCLDVLMLPATSYYSDFFFEIFHQESGSDSTHKTSMIAYGGRYDDAVHQMWDPKFQLGAPGAVGVDVLLENILHHFPSYIRPPSLDRGSNVLVCLKGGAELLQECMDLVADLWNSKIVVEFVPLRDPTLAEQYEYANKHDIKCLIILTEASLPPNRLLKVWHVELEEEKSVERGEIVKFLQEAFSTNFRNFKILS